MVITNPRLQLPTSTSSSPVERISFIWVIAPRKLILTAPSISLELDPETEIKLIEDLEPGKDGLPKMSKILPTMMVNTKTGEKVLTLIKESHMKEFMSKAELMSAHNVQLKDKVSWKLKTKTQKAVL